MDLQNSFVVPADIDKAWATLLDVEKIAPCMPGATLDTIDGDNFTGHVKVKLGPVTMVYGGKASFVSKDEATHTAVIEGTGKETKGSGTAKAHVTCVLVSETPETTRVNVTTDLTITGKAAQFGRGVMQEVAGRLVDQFANNLSDVMSGVEEVAPAAAGIAGAAAANGSAATGSAPRVTPARPASDDAIDLLGTAGAPVLKQAAPFAIGALVLGLIVWLLRRK